MIGNPMTDSFKRKLKDNPQMQNQVLYAPFVKAQDKVKKDVHDLSLSDF